MAHPDSWVGKLTAVEGIGGRRICKAMIGARERERREGGAVGCLGSCLERDREGRRG